MNSELSTQLSELVSAEGFCDFLNVEYDPVVLQRKRIPLLRMFHHILESFQDEPTFEEYQKALRIAYRQIVNGNELSFTASQCDGCSDCD